MVLAIARHCKSLRVFSIHFQDYQASLEPIWSTVGSTLIELAGDVPEREWAHITSHCMCIEKLDMYELAQLTLNHADALI